jgi:hypothetical protein
LQALADCSPQTVVLLTAYALVLVWLYCLAVQLNLLVLVAGGQGAGQCGQQRRLP